MTNLIRTHELIDSERHYRKGFSDGSVQGYKKGVKKKHTEEHGQSFKNGFDKGYTKGYSDALKLVGRARCEARELSALKSR